ncbi:MAG: threonylcarbamoyl-AMP synthase [Candidatus Omnitrophica bacterium]|nr:threonylcarbamoyl-AMP synthase [Candidatus Omnitrophota bacterium]MBU1128081.1 threonylcarbamoyl-AMP synthase [Candidatus Omnitrophota bacterium]MBU1656677.1 threonylcarbamoyl-AMP synthase [Candidatus Omnitrophota bacterium]MBU1785041.1 threonylcarbamoyl-AMP synthase [Candidatus Omnitrophota bacterium]MBU1851893.1 threonylcarbamoyl-AMP synthase [Candidatus Omnitrophota bacterium]
MRPNILRIDPGDIDDVLIGQAAREIQSGGLVAFPTETVYGLGANAMDQEAVAGIFEAKKRPLDDPLIVHIANRDDLSWLVEEVPDEAKKLIDRFWPGPLTLILKKTDRVPDIVTTGLSTVAVRMPSNDIAKRLIKASGCPVAAPSANLFGRPSPTTAQHVIDDLNGSVDIVLDGGKTDIGVESTVVEIVSGKVIVLRPGGIDVEELRSVVGMICVYTEKEVITKSPGKYPQHYSPLAEVVIVDDDPQQVEKVLLEAHEASGRGLSVGVMAKEEHALEYEGFHCKVLGPSIDARACASELFHVLREFDKDDVDLIIAEAIPEAGIGLAVMNRLKKAAGIGT